MNKNLKPCPLCTQNVVISTSEEKGYYVTCGGCGLTTEVYQREYQLIRYWDNRPDSGQSESLEKIDGRLASIEKTMNFIEKMATTQRPDLKEIPE